MDFERIWYCIYTMSEIQTEHHEQTKPTEHEPLQTTLFDEAIEMQEKDAARRILDDSSAEIIEFPQQNLNQKDSSFEFSKKQKTAAVVAALAAGAGIGVHIAENTAPTFSEETTEYQVQPGDGMYSVAETIPGYNTEDPLDIINHISVDPANIDALKDGLQPGETLSVPVSINGVEASDE